MSVKKWPILVLVAMAGYGLILANSQGNRRAVSPAAVAASAPATAAPQPPPPLSHGKLKVDRVWKDDQIDYGYALVSYENNSGAAFSGGVTIQCNALDAKDGKIGTNTRSFFSHEYGPIQPGFTGTLKIPVELNGAAFDSMRCWIASAR